MSKNVNGKRDLFSVIMALLIFPIFIVYFWLSIPFIRIKDKRNYKKSFYFKDFKKPFKDKIFYSGAYIFYNSARERNLPIEYVSRLPEKTDYFKYNDTLYFFPNERKLTISYNEYGRNYQFCYGRGKKAKIYSPEELLKELSEGISESSGLKAKLFTEAMLFQDEDPYSLPLPDCIYLARTYASAFSAKEKRLRTAIPKNVGDLYEMIKNTPDLCGNFSAEGDRIKWNIDKATITIIEDEETTYKRSSEYFTIEIAGNDEDSTFQTSDVPTRFDVYDKILSLGKRGNITIYRKSSGKTLYSGPKEKCPKELLGGNKKLFIIEADSAPTEENAEN
ncbi:MAG TPA: hypothetical protein IAB64_03445 [Candidatus Coproplasma excrementavium]|nr:hypothetical protein [Candidatus Coproplasma excrementavium]